MKQYPARHKEHVNVQRLQFPLQPAHAKTVHRSQSNIRDTVVVDLLHHISLSRLTSLDGLPILDL
jgi:hypothetical protein